jgi:hypothetical protein
VSRLRGVLASGLLAAAALGCSKPPPPPPVVPPPVQPVPPPLLSPPFSVKALHFGKSAYTDGTVPDATDTFSPKDTVFLSVASEGVDAKVVLRARWYGPNGTVLQESTQDVSSVGPKATAFHLDNHSGMAVGKYSVDVFVNDRPAGTKSFDVLKRPLPD